MVLPSCVLLQCFGEYQTENIAYMTVLYLLHIVTTSIIIKILNFTYMINAATIIHTLIVTMIISINFIVEIYVRYTIK